MEKINIEQFKKLDLRIAEIEEVWEVEDSNKLLVLKVNLCNEKRQIVAGIGDFYKKEDLKGKKIVLVSNLKSKKIKNIESEGMLLAAQGENGEVVLIIPEKDLPPGSKIS